LCIELCDEVTCQFGGICQYEDNQFVGCVCNFTCDAVRYAYATNAIVDTASRLAGVEVMLCTVTHTNSAAISVFLGYVFFFRFKYSLCAYSVKLRDGRTDEEMRLFFRPFLRPFVCLFVRYVCQGVHPVGERSAMLHIHLGGGVKIRDQPTISHTKFSQLIIRKITEIIATRDVTF